MGDTLLHYAAYKSLRKLAEYLVEHDADPYLANNVPLSLTKRYLTPIDVALPEIREWLSRKHQETQQERLTRQKTTQSGKKELL
jgi:ankyrin repeat protein